jgi:purine-binding chemotaxis protein CheW
MKEREYLILEQSDLTYAIDAMAVREIIAMPELRPLATAPRDIIGTIEWRLQTIPVMHLNLRFGRNFKGCKTNSQIVLFNWQSSYIGIATDRVLDVKTLSPQSMEIELVQGRGIESQSAFITGIANYESRQVVCLDLERLIREPDVLTSEDLVINELGDAEFRKWCYPQASDRDFERLKLRSDRIRDAIDETFDRSAGSTTTADFLAVESGGEYLGFPLESIIDVDSLAELKIFPIPGAKGNLLGQINWRGDILPIIEVNAGNQTKRPTRSEFAIAKIDNILVGVAIDRVLDTIYLDKNAIEPPPLSLSPQQRANLHGVSKYENDSIISLLKLSEQIQQEFLN